MHSLISHVSGFYPFPRRRGNHGRPDKILTGYQNDLGSCPDVSFGLFSQLPMELRLVIWEMAMDEQRVVVISNRLKKNPRDPYEFRGFKSLTPAPVTLYVCSESRSLSLSKHDLISGLGEKKARPNPGAGFFFNYEKDILYIRNVWDDHYRLVNNYSPMYGSAQSLMEMFLKTVPKEQTQQIQSIAFDIFTAFPIMSLYFLDKEQPAGLKSIYLCSEDLVLDVRKVQLLALEEKHHEYFKSEAICHFGLPLRRNVGGPGGYDIPSMEHIETAGLSRYPQLRRILEVGPSPNLILVNAVNPVN